MITTMPRAELPLAVTSPAAFIVSSIPESDGLGTRERRCQQKPVVRQQVQTTDPSCVRASSGSNEARARAYPTIETDLVRLLPRVVALARLDGSASGFSSHSNCLSPFG